jgi:hypothetical protein
MGCFMVGLLGSDQSTKSARSALIRLNHLDEGPDDELRGGACRRRITGMTIEPGTA